MRILLLFLPLLTHFFSSAMTLNCNTNQYRWPIKMPTKCCKKCEPGTYMEKRCDVEETKCAPCEETYYMDVFHNEFRCKMCSYCIKDHMVYKKSCTRTTNSVCDCEHGYRCTDNLCQSCEKIPPPPSPPTTTPSPPPPPLTTTTAMTTAPEATAPPTKQKTLSESVWIALNLCCACVCILLTCFILISRHTPVRGRDALASAVCFWAVKKNSSASSSHCTEDEEVPMPIQEEGKENV